MVTKFYNLRNEDEISVIIIQAGMGLESFIKSCIVILKQSTLLKTLGLILMYYNVCSYTHT